MEDLVVKSENEYFHLLFTQAGEDLLSAVSLPIGAKIKPRGPIADPSDAEVYTVTKYTRNGYEFTLVAKSDTTGLIREFPCTMVLESIPGQLCFDVEFVNTETSGPTVCLL